MVQENTLMPTKPRFLRISAHGTIKLRPMTGMMKPAAKCMMPVCLPMAMMSSALRFNGAKPNQVGVPTAPNDTGTEFITRVKIATFNGLKPRLIRIGAAIAAGVPKPDAPSIIKANAQPIIINCATGFGLMVASHLRITSIQPVVSIMWLNIIAPKITVIGVRVETRPDAAVALSSMASSSK